MRFAACEEPSDAEEVGINVVDESVILRLAVDAVERGDELSVFRVQDLEKLIELVFLTNGTWTALVGADPMCRDGDLH